MDIIPLDRDDDVMLKELFGVACRSEAVSRVQPIQRTEEEFLKGVRFDFPGEREESAVAVVDGSPAGWARVYFPERDNLDKCWSQLEVDPQHRGQGIGSALVEWTEQRATCRPARDAPHRGLRPVGDRESHADREFALQTGVCRVERRDRPLAPAADRPRRPGAPPGAGARGDG